MPSKRRDSVPWVEPSRDSHTCLSAAPPPLGVGLGRRPAQWSPRAAPRRPPVRGRAAGMQNRDACCNGGAESAASLGASKGLRPSLSGLPRAQHTGRLVDTVSPEPRPCSPTSTWPYVLSVLEHHAHPTQDLALRLSACRPSPGISMWPAPDLQPQVPPGPAPVLPGEASPRRYFPGGPGGCLPTLLPCLLPAPSRAKLWRAGPPSSPRPGEFCEGFQAVTTRHPDLPSLHTTCHLAEGKGHHTTRWPPVASPRIPTAWPPQQTVSAGRHSGHPITEQRETRRPSQENN